MLIKFSQILFCVLLFTVNVVAQLELKVLTNKDTYEYGEMIYITCSVTNISDSTISIRSGSYNSCQAEFEFNDYYSGFWTACLPLVQELVFHPKISRKYSWTIDPKIFGLPNKDGMQKVVGHFFYKGITDTVYINAPMFLGGQLNVGFPKQNDTLLLQLKDSLNVVVLDRTDYPFSNNISETWQINDFQLDSLYGQLINDKRFEWVEYNRFIMYDSINVTSVENELTIIDNYYLSNAYPNPFNPTTTINYQLALSGFVTLKVYDALGRVISILVNEEKPAGKHEVIFDGSGLSSGVYFYRLQTNSFTQTKKLLLIK